MYSQTHNCAQSQDRSHDNAWAESKAMQKLPMPQTSTWPSVKGFRWQGSQRWPDFTAGCNPHVRTDWQTFSLTSFAPCPRAAVPIYQILFRPDLTSSAQATSTEGDAPTTRLRVLWTISNNENRHLTEYSCTNLKTKVSQRLLFKFCSAHWHQIVILFLNITNDQSQNRINKLGVNAFNCQVPSFISHPFEACCLQMKSQQNCMGETV